MSALFGALTVFALVSLLTLSPWVLVVPTNITDRFPTARRERRPTLAMACGAILPGLIGLFIVQNGT